MSEANRMKQHAADVANGSFAGSFIVATIAGWSVQEWAACAALVYSLLLIFDKLGILAPLRGLVVRTVTWCWRLVWSRGRRA